MTYPLTPEYLEGYLHSKGLDGYILRLSTPTPTVESAAQAVGASTDDIVKSVLFTVEGKPVLAITCGTRAIDRRQIAKRFNVGRKKVKLADAATVLEVTGYPVGTVPPFAHRQQIFTLIDPQVLKHEIVFAGGGAVNALMRINPKLILAESGAEILNLHTPDEQ